MFGLVQVSRVGEGPIDSRLSHAQKLFTAHMLNAVVMDRHLERPNHLGCFEWEPGPAAVLY